MNEDRWRRRCERLRRRAEAAEELLDTKSRELFVANRDLRNLADCLEERVRSRTEELRIARDRADAASRAKSAFLAAMSHELRTPLSAILGYIELLEEEADEVGALDALGHDLTAVHTSADYLLCLINDVLDLAKVEAGEMRVEATSVPLGPLLHRVAQTIGPLASAHATGVEVRVEPSVSDVLADPVRLEQCLLNIAGNAAKVTEAGRVELVGSVPRPGRVRIRIVDTGPGIPPEEASRLFRPYHQTRAEETRRRGTGLGLVLTRRLMLLMGGNVELERSTVGVGSVFALELPAA